MSAWGQSGRKLAAITRIMTSLRSTSTKRRLSLYSSHTGLTTAITLNFGIVDGLRFWDVYQNCIRLLAPVVAKLSLSNSGPSDLKDNQLSFSPMSQLKLRTI